MLMGERMVDRRMDCGTCEKIFFHPGSLKHYLIIADHGVKSDYLEVVYCPTCGKNLEVLENQK